MSLVTDWASHSQLYCNLSLSRITYHLRCLPNPQSDLCVTIITQMILLLKAAELRSLHTFDWLGLIMKILWIYEAKSHRFQAGFEPQTFESPMNSWTLCPLSNLASVLLDKKLLFVISPETECFSVWTIKFEKCVLYLETSGVFWIVLKTGPFLYFQN